MFKKDFTAPERTFERGQGCYNCIHYENGERSKQHWGSHKMRLLNSLAKSMPLIRLDEDEVSRAKDARLDQVRQMDTAIATGVVGMCNKGARPMDMGGPPGDFVEHRFLCNRWTGKDGASLATGGKMDLLPDGELEERALDRVGKKR
jgi:hypothetical protein